MVVACDDHEVPSPRDRLGATRSHVSGTGTPMAGPTIGGRIVSATTVFLEGFEYSTLVDVAACHVGRDQWHPSSPVS